MIWLNINTYFTSLLIVMLRYCALNVYASENNAKEVNDNWSM